MLKLLCIYNILLASFSIAIPVNTSEALVWTPTVTTSQYFPGSTEKIDFLTYPKMIDGGVTVFIAGSFSDVGILRYSKGELSIVVDRNTLMPGHDAGTFRDVALGSFHDVAPNQEVFVGYGSLLGDSGVFLAAEDNAPVQIVSTFDTVPNVGGNFFGFVDAASNNNGKTVAFNGYTNTWDGIYSKQDNSPIHVVADLNTKIPKRSDGKTMNYYSGAQVYQDADVMFFGSRMREAATTSEEFFQTGHLKSGDTDLSKMLPTWILNRTMRQTKSTDFIEDAIPGLYHYHADTNELTIIANLQTTVPGLSSHTFEGFSDPIIAGDHYVTFRGIDSRGAIGIYMFDIRNGNLQSIVDNETPLPQTSGRFDWFDNLPAVCDDYVLFQTITSPATYQGVYKWRRSDGELSPVLLKTDTVMGYSLDLVKLGHHSCVGDNVAFYLVLKNGPFGHYTTFI